MSATVTLGADRPQCRVILPRHGGWAFQMDSGTDPMPSNVSLVFTSADNSETVWPAVATGVSTAGWDKTAAEVAALIATDPRRARLMQGVGDAQIEWLRDGSVEIK